jgi:hypothetical protein
MSQPEANTILIYRETVSGCTDGAHAQVVRLLPECQGISMMFAVMKMARAQEITPAKRKRLLKTFGTCPSGYTNDDLERFLDLLYGMYSHEYTSAQLRQIVVCDPFDHSETPRRLKLVELADWLEALVA